MCKKTPGADEMKFERCHTFAKLLESAIFERIMAFFFTSELSKMQQGTFIKQKTNK